jgi:hypothetical protein
MRWWRKEESSRCSAERRFAAFTGASWIHHLDAVAPTVSCPIEAGGITLVRSQRYKRLDVVPVQAGADAIVAVPLVAHYKRWFPSDPPASVAIDLARLHQRLEERRFVPLSAGEHKDEGPASAFGA